MRASPRLQLIPITAHLDSANAGMRMGQVGLNMQRASIERGVVCVAHDGLAEEVEAVHEMAVRPGEGLVVADLVDRFSEDVLFKLDQMIRDSADRGGLPRNGFRGS